MNGRSAMRAAAVLGAAAALSVGLVNTSASADPGAGEFRQLVAVGSDTTQDVLNGLANGFGTTAGIPDPDETPDDQLIASYDATPKGTGIQTRAAGCSIARPDGSSAGIAALNADIAAGTHCIDVARSSRGPNATGTNLTFVPFGKDAVTWAVRSDSPLAGANLSLADLKAIYNCTLTTVNGVAVSPLVPQDGSGTRTFWATAMGIDPDDADLPACVSDRNNTVQEHNGSALTGAGDIMPFSIASYIAQSNASQTEVTDRRGPAVLNPVGGQAPTVGGALNPSFQQELTRDVYNVVQTSRLNESDIHNTFVGSSSAVCSRTGTVTLFGFGSLGSACGSTSVTGNS